MLTAALHNAQDAISALSQVPEARRTVPTRLTQAIARRNAIDTIADRLDPMLLIEALAEADPEDITRILDEFAIVKARAETFDLAQKRGLRDMLDSRITQELLLALPDMVRQLQPLVTKHAAQLQTYAPRLPAGQAALDPAAVIETGDLKPYLETQEAVKGLIRLAGIYTGQMRHSSSRPRGIEVVRLVDVPETTVELQDLAYERVYSTEQEQEIRRTVQQLVESYATADVLTLINVARGEYPGCTISLAASPDEVEARAQRVETAHLRRMVSEPTRFSVRSA